MADMRACTHTRAHTHMYTVGKHCTYNQHDHLLLKYAQWFIKPENIIQWAINVHTLKCTDIKWQLTVHAVSAWWFHTKTTHDMQMVGQQPTHTLKHTQYTAILTTAEAHPHTINFKTIISAKEEKHCDGRWAAANKRKGRRVDSRSHKQEKDKILSLILLHKPTHTQTHKINLQIFHSHTHRVVAASKHSQHRWGQLREKPLGHLGVFVQICTFVCVREACV